MTTPLKDEGFDMQPMTAPTGEIFKLKLPSSSYRFTEDDLDVWPYYKSYLIELLNGEYSIEEAREDLLSLLAVKNNRKVENNDKT